MKTSSFFLILLSVLFIFPSKANSQGNSSKAPKGGKAGKMQQLRLIPIGVGRIPKYVAGDVAPVEIKGRPEEYMPQSLYIKNKGYKKIRLNRNSLSLPISIKRSESITFYKKNKVKNEEGKITYTYTPYVKTKIDPRASQVLVVIIKSLKKEVLWKTPLIKAFNISPEVFPPNTCFIFNATPLGLGVKFADRDATYIREMNYKIIKDLKCDEYNAIPYTIGLKVGEKFEHVRTGAFRQKSDSRYYIFGFVDPRKNIKKHGDLAVFTESDLSSTISGR